MRDLTSAEIEKFASRKGVRRIAVENFLGSLGDAGSEANEIANAKHDAGLYGWKKPTVAAINAGIHLAYKR